MVVQDAEVRSDHNAVAINHSRFGIVTQCLHSLGHGAGKIDIVRVKPGNHIACSPLEPLVDSLRLPGIWL